MALEPVAPAPDAVAAALANRVASAGDRASGVTPRRSVRNDEGGRRCHIDARRWPSGNAARGFGRRSLRPDTPWRATREGVRPRPAARRPRPAHLRAPHPEHGVLQRVVREHLETFLARPASPAVARAAALRRARVARLPRLRLTAERLRPLRCRELRERVLVAFSCKGRGFCPSCCGRRMAVLAAHLSHGRRRVRFSPCHCPRP